MNPAGRALWSGALHYWRVPPAAWPRCLAALREMGLPLVETYVPWSVHERAPGEFDFAGPRDLAAFVRQAQRAGLGVLLRPGPHINAELTGFGFPRWILDDPLLQARTAEGSPALVPAPPQMFAAPSYASRRFLDAAKGWYRRVAAEVAELCRPGGPIVGLQVDNECSYFFRLGAFDQDYHPDALLAWRAENGPVDPPRAAGRDEARALAWIDFKERQIVRALETLQGGLREVGLGGEHLVHWHNFPPGDPLHVPLPETERALGLAGLDLYHQASEYDRVRRRMLYLAGTSRLPYVPELQSGGWAWWAPLGLSDARTTTLAALMHGMKAFNLYMAVDRDRWFGAPIGPDGERREEAYGFWRRLLTVLGEIGWPDLARRIEVAAVAPRKAARAALASSLLDPAPPMAYGLLGLRMVDVAAEGPAEALREHDRAVEILTRAHVPFVVVEEERAGGYRFVVRTAADAERAAAAAAAPFAAREPEVDTALWGEDVLFVGTRSPSPLCAQVALARPARLRDLLEGGHLEPEPAGPAGQQVRVPLRPFEVRLFRIEAA